jgi:hypothetical protein
MCKASVDDVTVPPEQRWSNLHGRLAFAPVTEMSEEYIRDAEAQMDALRATAQQAVYGASSLLISQATPQQLHGHISW